MCAVRSARPARSGGFAAPPVLIIRLKSISGRSWNSTSTTSRPFFSLKRFGLGGLNVGSGAAGRASCRNGASGVSRATGAGAAARALGEGALAVGTGGAPGAGAGGGGGGGGAQERGTHRRSAAPGNGVR